MSDSNADQQEPSMEEILASIRRIISEDGEEESAADDEVSPEVEENVAVAEVEVEPVVVESEPELEPAPLADIDDDILELTDVIEDEPEPEPEPLLDDEPAIEIKSEVEPELAILIEEEKLVSDEVEEVSVASMSGLTAALAANALVGNGDKTLEQLVKDVLRPILKEWLDTNLPETVERIVREEVERIADRARK